MFIIMRQGDIGGKGIKGLKIKAVNIVSAVVAAGIAVGAVSAHNCGSADEVSLQSPSILGPDAAPFDVDGAAMESEEIGIIPMTFGNAHFDINKYTYVADTEYSDIMSEYGKNPTDPITYDGVDNWLKNNTVLLVIKDGISDDEDENEGDSDEVKDLLATDKVFVISHTKEWSLVKLEDGTQGYVRNQFLSAKEVTEETLAEENDDDEDNESSSSDEGSSSSSSSSSSSYSEPDPEPEPDNSSSSSSSSGRDWDESSCDITVYASCALNTRTGPGISYTRLSTLSFGTEIDVVAETDNGWYKSSDGWYVKASLTLDEEPEPEPVYYDDDDDDDDDYDYSDFASYVRSFIGCRYVYGGASPDGFDCSGFVMYCYQTYYNIYLPHGATSQSYRGEEVDPDDIQVGDIICFDKEGDGTMEHAGLYVGNDTYVHAKGAAYGVVEDCYSAAKWKIGTVRRVL